MRPGDRSGGIDEPGDVLDERGDVVARGDTRIREVVTFRIIDAGTHLQDLEDRHAVVTAAFQLGQVTRNGRVQRVDAFFGERTADQHRRNRFGHRPTDEARGGDAVVPVNLADNVAVLHYQQGVRVRTFQNVGCRVVLAEPPVGEVERVIVCA